MQPESIRENQLCSACPRHCQADRDNGQGVCRTPDSVFMTAQAYLHPWEEPVISGRNGSGTVFFSGCNLACVFCQNHVISQERRGYSLTPGMLEDLCFSLEEKGAHNINFVTPDHYLSSLAPVLRNLKQHGLKIPVCLNSNGYSSVEMLRQLDGLVDIYLPDLKYFSDQYARRYSKVTYYFETASAAIREMVRQTGPFLLKNGLMQKGVIVRHLELPGLYFDSRKVLRWLWGEFGHTIFLSLMNQYTPLHDAAEYPEINRELYPAEYDRLVDFAFELGFRNCFYQEEKDKACYTPAFEGEGVREYLLRKN